MVAQQTVLSSQEISSVQKTQPPTCVRSRPSNGFRDAAFVWSWLLGVSVKQGSFTLKLHDQELWKKVSTIFHEKKFPQNQSFIKNFTERRKERTVADTFSGDRFLNVTPKKGGWVLSLLDLSKCLVSTCLIMRFL